MDAETMALAGAALLGVVAVGRFVSKFTETEADDRFFARAGDVLRGFFKSS